MKNKLIIGLLLIAQVGGVIAFDGSRVQPRIVPKSESELLEEYKVYVANSNPYTQMYVQRAAQLKMINAQLTALKKNDPTNTYRAYPKIN